MKTKVDQIVPREDDSSLAKGVVVNGQTIEADFIVMGVGVAPATEYLKNSGLPLEKDGSIKVDEYLRVLGLPGESRGVYAIGNEALMSAIIFSNPMSTGDIATYPHVKTQAHVRVEHWNVRDMGVSCRSVIFIR
jgi:apoptosis-inducing factor 3